MSDRLDFTSVYPGLTATYELIVEAPSVLPALAHMLGELAAGGAHIEHVEAVCADESATLRCRFTLSDAGRLDAIVKDVPGLADIRSSALVTHLRSPVGTTFACAAFR